MSLWHPIWGLPLCPGMTRGRVGRGAGPLSEVGEQQLKLLASQAEAWSSGRVLRIVPGVSVFDSRP